MAARHSSSGTFVVLEGPDGSGTTTHAKLLAQTLAGEHANVLYTAEPTDGPVGSAIRGFLRSGTLPHDALQLLFTADRAWHVHQEIEPTIAAGGIVISDRYALSTLAYGEALGLDPAWLLEMNKKFIQPDCTILTLPPLSVCMERIGERGIHDVMEVRDLQERIHASYTRMAAQDPSIVMIDTSVPADEAALSILNAVRKHLQ